MKFKSGRFIALAFSLSLGTASAQTYVATDLTTNSSPVIYSSGQINGTTSLFQAGSAVTGGLPMALLWQGSATNAINMNPSGYRQAVAYGVNGTNTVGQGVTVAGQTNALYWQATAAPTAVSLNPTIGSTNALSSAAYGISNTQQVGYAQNITNASPVNAYLWRGTAASAVDLNPTGYASSVAYATDDRHQVGYAVMNGSSHAILWFGGPSSYQDLHPAGYATSQALAVAQQIGGTNSVAVGYAQVTGTLNVSRAFVWPVAGVTNYPVSLHPPGYLMSMAKGISGTNVVGYGVNAGGGQVALLWQGFSSNSVVNLSSALPAGGTNAVATCIDPTGTFIGGYATFGSQTHAILWRPATAPAFTNSVQNLSIGANIPYKFTFGAAGRPTPTYSASAGLPPGLTLATNGMLSGAATATGTFTGIITAGNGISPAATQNFTYNVLPTPVVQYSTVGSFTSSHGDVLGFAPICQDNAGNFYGVDYSGGTNSDGTLWEMTSTGTETVLHAFGNSSTTNDGALPTSVISGPNNVLYGTAAIGGGSGNGAIFSYSQGAENVVYGFKVGNATNDGNFPIGPVMRGNDGNFYGTTTQGGISNSGVVYKVAPMGTETILHSFLDGTVPHDGYRAATPLIQANDGNFYGTTYYGGSANGYGCVYRITPSGSLTIVRGFFDGTVPNDGRNAAGGVTQGTDGNFYGMTITGGNAGKGIIYRLSPSGQYAILHNLGDPTVGGDAAMPQNASAPQQVLVQGPDGNFYGTTGLGGTANTGALFMISPSGTMIVLHSFGDGNSPGEGTSPTGNLILGTDGSFYGETLAGGASNLGTIFKFSVFSAPVFTNTSTTLAANNGQSYDFAFTANGSPAPTFSLTAGNLPSGLTLSSGGVLSGTPTQDGTYVFTITASNSAGNPVSQSFTLTITDQATDTPVMPPYGLAMLAALLVVAAIFKPRPRIA